MPKKQLSDRIRRLERRRATVLAGLLARDPLVRGSLTRVLQRCGKPTCHCAQKPSHPVWRLLTSRSGAQRCQLVRQDDIERIQVLVQRSKAFARGLRELDDIHHEQKALLRVVREKRDPGYD